MMIQDPTRDEALLLVRQYVSKENNVKHMIAVGAAMSSLATKLGQDASRWELGPSMTSTSRYARIEDHTFKARGLLEGWSTMS